MNELESKFDDPLDPRGPRGRYGPRRNMDNDDDWQAEDALEEDGIGEDEDGE